MSGVEKCAACGYFRYDGDSFDGDCPTCAIWAQDKIDDLRAEVARQARPLTDDQAGKLAKECGADRSTWKYRDAAIRQVRDKDEA